MVLEVVLNLRPQSLLSLRVQGQEVGGVGQCVGCGIIASSEEDSRVSHNGLIRESTLRLGVVFTFTTVTVHGGIDHQLKEVLILEVCDREKRLKLNFFR